MRSIFPRFIPFLVAAWNLGCAPNLGEFSETADQAPPPAEATGPIDLPSTTQPPAAPRPFPIVLAHGFISSAEVGFTSEIVAGLEKDGHRVFRTEVPPVTSVAYRAQILGPQIDTILRDTGAERVHIIAHSMGGLDARYLVSELGYASRVATVSTISTPHHGSSLADVALGVADGLGLEETVLDFIATELSPPSMTDPDLRSALRDLSEGSALNFNALVEDQPSVRYQSWAGLSKVRGRARGADMEACTVNNGNMVLPEVRDRLSSVFVPVALVVAGSSLRPHDGVVTVESARWGAFRGCIPADHFDETDEILDPDTGFDLVQFYRDIARELAATSG